MKTENIKELDKIDLIIHNAVNENASDIHIEPNSSDVTVRYRIDGVLKVTEHVTFNIFEKLLERIKIMAGLNPASKSPQDGRIILSISGKRIDLRVSVIPSLNGASICIRLLRADTISKMARLEDIHLGEENLRKLKSLYSKNSGRMIIVSGPVGSGKTTLLYMIINELNKETVKICTVEDPVEYQLEGITQIPINVKEGITFSSAARTLFRHDPDIVVLGEIRDLDTLNLGVQCALIGHLLISCIHAENSIATIFRLKNIGLPLFLIKDSQPGIIAQRLVRTLCPDCREAYVPEFKELKGISLPEGTYYKAKGCEKCHNTGYRGRIPVCEIFEFSPESAELFMSGCTEKELMKQAVKEGMKTLLDDAIRKAKEGLTSLDEVLRVL